MKLHVSNIILRIGGKPFIHYPECTIGLQFPALPIPHSQWFKYNTMLPYVRFYAGEMPKKCSTYGYTLISDRN